MTSQLLIQSLMVDVDVFEKSDLGFALIRSVQAE